MEVMFILSKKTLLLFIKNNLFIKNLIWPIKEPSSTNNITMANKLNKEYPSITATKELLKLNPEISVDQVKGYDRRARAQPFMLEHVKIIQSLTNELDEWRTEIQPDFTELRSPSEISSMIDDMYENIKELTQENEKHKELSLNLLIERDNANSFIEQSDGWVDFQDYLKDLKD